MHAIRNERRSSLVTVSRLHLTIGALFGAVTLSKHPKSEAPAKGIWTSPVITKIDLKVAKVPPDPKSECHLRSG